MTWTWTAARACRQDADTWQDRTDERRAAESAGLELSCRMLRVRARRAVCREGEQLTLILRGTARRDEVCVESRRPPVSRPRMQDVLGCRHHAVNLFPEQQAFRDLENEIN